MGKQLVIIGAGHAHLTILKNLQKYRDAGHDVTVVSSSSLHYYSGMGPGMLSGIYRPEEIRFNVQKMSEDRGAVFIWRDEWPRLEPKFAWLCPTRDGWPGARLICWQMPT